MSPDLRLPSVELAVLDMAGTTVRDAGAVEAAFGAAMAAAGIEPGSGRFDAALGYVRRTMGSAKIEVFRHLLGGDEERAATANRRFEQAYERAVQEGGAAPIPGAPEAIDQLRSAGVKVCLVTGFSSGTQRLLLDALGWHGRVDLALAPADAGRGRPWPDLVLAAVLRLGVSDVRAVAVAGDTANDLWTGWRAGSTILAGVLSGAHDRATLATAPHTHMLGSVAELPAVVAARLAER